MHPRSRVRLAATLLAIVALTGSASAQQSAPAPAPAPVAPEVGTLAPDFAVTGATRYGLLRDSVHLSDLRGKTVVLAFFYKARTKG